MGDQIASLPDFCVTLNARAAKFKVNYTARLIANILMKNNSRPSTNKRLIRVRQ